MAQGKRKFSAGITLLCFLVSQIFGPDYAHAFPASFPYEVSVKSGFNFDLPPEFGIIESRFLGNRQGTPVIFHIQEPHGDYASQKKIQGILHYLKNHYGVNTLLLEGSAVPLHPELLKFDPQDSKKSLQIAEALAKDSWITGSELFLAREPLAQAYGIEDLAAYNQNGKSLVEVLTQREKSKTFLQSLDLQIKRLQGTYLNPKLRNFISRIEDFEKERIALDAWLPELRGKAKEHLDIHLENPESQIDWPMLVRLFKLQEIEKKLNLGEFEKERKGFLGAIKIRNSKLGIRNQSKNKNSKFKTNPVLDLNHSNLKFVSDLEFRISNLLHQSLSHHQLSDPETGLLFEQMITRLPPDFPHHKYPNVKLFIAHLILQSELHAPALMREVQDLEWKIQKKLAVTPEEKQMVELLKSYRLLDKLLSLRLTGEEYEQMVGSRQEAVSSKQPAVLPPASGILPTALLSRFAALNSSHRVKNLNFRGASEIDTLYEKALEFYRLAKERDGIMVKNIEQYLKSEIRNPKFETNPKAQNLKSQTKKKALVSNLGHSNFEFVSDFGFRVSSLPKAVVVITGGFHSKPLQDYFSSHGYNYALITPKMSGIPKPENAYQNILQTYQENPSTQTATFHQIYWGALEPSEIHAHDRDPELFQRALLRAEVRMNPSLARASDRTSGGRSINKPVDWKIQTFDLIQSLRSRSEMRSTAVAPREQPNIQEMLQRALQLKPDEIKKLRMLYESLTERGKSVLLLSLQYWRETGAWPFRKDLVAFLQAKGYGTTLYTLGVAKLKNSLRISRDIIPVTWKRLGVVRLKGPAQKGDRGKYHSYYVPSESGMKQIQAVIENLSRPSRNTRILPAGILPQLSVVPALATTEHLVDQLGLNPGQDLNAEREYFERLPAVVELGRREAVQYADKLAVILETSRSVPVLEETLLALARMKAYKTVPAIRKKLLFTSTEGIWSHSVRIAAIRALEMLFARDSLPEIAKLLEDKHAGVRMRALQSIGYFLAVPDYESDIRSLAENDPADMIRRFSRDLLLQLLSSRSELRKDERLSEFKNGIEELEAMLKAALDETGSVETAVASIQRSLGFFTDVVVKVNFHPKQNIVVRNKNRPALSLEEEEFLWSAVSDLSRIARLILRETADPWTVQRFKMDTHPLERLLNFRLAGDPDQGNVLWSLEAMYRANLFAGSWYFETSPRWNEVIIGSGHGSEGVGLQDFTAMAKIFQAAATYSSSASLPWPLKFLFIAPAIVVLAGWPGLFWREMRRHEGALGEVRKVIPEKIPATPLSQQDVQERILIVPGSTVKLGNSGLELHLESLNLSKGIVLVKIVRAGNQGAVTLYWENINSPLLPFHETIPAQESFFSWRLKFGHPLILKWGEGDSRIILLLDLPKSGGGVFLKMSPFAVVSPPYAPPVLKPAAARPELRKEVIHPTKRSELRLNIFENPVFADGAEGLQQWFVPGVIGVFILGSIAFGLYLFLTKPSTNKLLKKVGTAAFSLNDLGSLVGQYKKSVNDQTRIVEGLVSLILSKCRFLAGDELAKSEQKMKPTELAFVRKLGETAFQKFASLAASGGWAEVAFKSKLLMHAEKGDPAGKVLEIIYGWFAGLTELNHDKKLGFLHDVLADTFPNWTASAKAAKMLLAFAEQDSGAGEVTEEKGKTKIDYTEGIRSLIRLLPGPNGQSFEPERNYAVVVWELLEIKKEGKHEKWDEPIKQALKRLVRDIIPQAINPIHANTIALLKDSGFLVSVHEGASSSGGVSESEPLRSELRAGLSSSIGSEVRGGSVENLKKLIVEYHIDRSAVFVQGVKNLIRRMEAYEQTPYLETLSGFLSEQSADQAKLLSNAILDFVPEAMKAAHNRAGFPTSLMLSLYPFRPKRIRSMIVALTQINSDLYRGRKGTLKGNAFLAFINWLDVFGKQDKAPTKIKELYDALIVQNKNIFNHCLMGLQSSLEVAEAKKTIVRVWGAPNNQVKEMRTQPIANQRKIDENLDRYALLKAKLLGGTTAKGLTLRSELRMPGMTEDELLTRLGAIPSPRSETRMLKDYDYLRHARDWNGHARLSRREDYPVAGEDERVDNSVEPFFKNPSPAMVEWADRERKAVESRRLEQAAKELTGFLERFHLQNPAADLGIQSGSEMEVFTKRLFVFYQGWSLKVAQEMPKVKKRERTFEEELSPLFKLLKANVAKPLAQEALKLLAETIPKVNFVFYADEFIASKLPPYSYEEIKPGLKKLLEKLREGHTGKITHESLPGFRREVFRIRQSITARSGQLLSAEGYVFSKVAEALYSELKSVSASESLIPISFDPLIQRIHHEQISDAQEALFGSDPVTNSEETGLGITVRIWFGEISIKDTKVFRYTLSGISPHDFQKGFSRILEKFKSNGLNYRKNLFHPYRVGAYVRVRGQTEFVAASNDFSTIFDPEKTPDTIAQDLERFFSTKNLRGKPFYFSTIADIAFPFANVGAIEKALMERSELRNGFWELPMTPASRLLFSHYRDNTVPPRLSREEATQWLEKLLGKSLARQVHKNVIEGTFETVGDAKVWIAETLKRSSVNTEDSGKILLDESVIRMLYERDPESLGILAETLNRQGLKQSVAIETLDAQALRRMLTNRRVGLSSTEIDQIFEFVGPQERQKFSERNQFGVAALTLQGQVYKSEADLALTQFVLRDEELQHLTDRSAGGIIFLFPALLSAARLVRNIKDPKEQRAVLIKQLQQILPGGVWNGTSIEVHLADYLRTIFAGREQVTHSA